jgi:hypothetical protein
LFLACRTKEQFFIQWQSNGRTKWVKRLNLILLDEDRAAFRFRLKQAQRRRDEVRHMLPVVHVPLFPVLAGHAPAAVVCLADSHQHAGTFQCCAIA